MLIVFLLSLLLLFSEISCCSSFSFSFNFPVSSFNTFVFTGLQLQTFLLQCHLVLEPKGILCLAGVPPSCRVRTLNWQSIACGGVCSFVFLFHCWHCLDLEIFCERKGFLHMWNFRRLTKFTEDEVENIQL